eukprot:COSAG06_NODE_20822_length_780_cov_0.649046_2_plen_84_part_00
MAFFVDPDGYLNNPQGVSCVVKHYLGYGHAEQGGIDGGPATLDEQTLRERYLPPWKAIADEGCGKRLCCADLPRQARDQNEKS